LWSEIFRSHEPRPAPAFGARPALAVALRIAQSWTLTYDELSLTMVVDRTRGGYRGRPRGFADDIEDGAVARCPD
jgi:hypothetical protein